MHTRHVTTPPPAFASDEAAKCAPPTPVRGTTPDKGPKRVGASRVVTSSVMIGRTFNEATTYSRASPYRPTATAPLLLTNGRSPSASPPSPSSLVPRSRDKPLGHSLGHEGTHAMLDCTGPNIASGPIPRDGFTSDAYEALTRQRLHEMGWSDVLGETGARPVEIGFGAAHLDRLARVGPSAKDRAASEGS